MTAAVPVWAAPLVALSLWTAACSRDTPHDAAAAPDARFGVLFGGQIQQLDEIAFEVDQAKQAHGFRIDFAAPLEQPTVIEWELDMPGSTRGVRDPKGRVGRGRITRLGRLRARPEDTRIDHTLRFEPGDPLGIWNIRVVTADRVLIDRPFRVYDAAARARGASADAGL